MPTAKMGAEALILLFEGKAAASPPESNQMLVRHLQCKESLAMSRCVAEAMGRFAGPDRQLLVVPTQLLPPLA